MLGFKGSKCKTSCKLCVSRIKLLRNKREIQLTQQRRVIGQLLKDGKRESAWVRVEGIIREQNLMTAYEILELYLELIAVRIQLLERNKTCPRDMIEAITSLMYAAPRVADLPELVEVRKWLAIKYGKELGVEGSRNFQGETPYNWQVNLKLRSCLAVEAPEPEDKLTVISAIAQESQVDFNLEEYSHSIGLDLEDSVAVTKQPSLDTPMFPPISHTPQMTPQVSTFQATPSPISPPRQPNFQVPFEGQTKGPYTDVMMKMTGQVPDCKPDTFSPKEGYEEKSFDELQKQYDEVPSAPEKPHESESDDESFMPPAPPSPPAAQSGFPIDDDLTRRLAQLRKR